jgi:FkbM family methyltransferase
MSGPDLHLRAVRLVLRRYPWIRGRWRLATLLLIGGLDPRRLAPGVVSRLPERIVDCRHGIHLPVYRDAAYLAPYLFGDHEPASTEILRRLVPVGGRVIDVGANLGWYASLFARWVGPTGRVLAFEPVPQIAGLTRRALALNDPNGTARLEEAAVGAKSGEMTIYTFPGLPHGHASGSNLDRRDAVPHRCRVVTLDDYVGRDEATPPDLLKVDVEGFEREVFIGGADMLGRPDAPIVHFEVNQACLAHRGVSVGQVEKLLRQLSYSEFWHIRPSGGARSVQTLASDHDGDYLAAKPATASRVQAALLAEPARAVARRGIARRLRSRTTVASSSSPRSSGNSDDPP